MTTYGPFPRDAQGRIIVGPLFDESGLRDEPPAATPAAPADPASAPQPPPAAPRRRGETPTPIDQLRPGAAGGPTQAAAPARGESWQTVLAWGAVLVILAGAGFFLSRSNSAAPSAAATAAEGSAAVAAGTAEATATAPPAALLARAIVVFDVPNGTPVGALEPGRAYTLLDERGDWRQLDVPDSGIVWARAWEMDGEAPPAPTVAPAPAPAPAPPQRPAQPAQPAPVVVPVGPQVTCLPVVDADNGNRYLGDACGATSEERQARALEMLQQAPPPTLPGQP